MQIRPLRVADLDLIDEIDATLESNSYLHVDRHAEGLSARFTIEERALTDRRVASGTMEDDLRFDLKQTAAGIEEGFALVAEHDAVPIGALLARHPPGSDLVELIDLRVDFDQRRQGLASAMLFQAINFARDREARAVRALTTTANVPAARLLAKLGFELAGIDTQRRSNHDLVKEQSTLVWYLALQ